MASKEMEKLFTCHSHHEQSSIIYTTQVYFKHNATISKNVNYRVLFSDPCDGLSIRNISSQLKWICNSGGASAFCPKCFEYLHKKFPENLFPYLLIDGSTHSGMKDLRVRSNIFPMEDGKIRPLCFLPNPHAK